MVDYVCLLGALVCYLVGLMYPLLMRVGSLPGSRFSYVILYTFTFLFIADLSSLYFYGYESNYGQLITPHRDDRQYLKYAQVFADTGVVTHSAFDVLNGLLILLYDFFALTPNVYTLMPTVWLASAILPVVVLSLAHSLVRREIWFAPLIVVSILFSYTFLYLGTGLWRDTWGLLPIAYGIYFSSQQKFVRASFLAILAFLFRGSNGVVSFLSNLFIYSSRVLNINRVISIIGIIIVVTVGGYVADFLLPIVGSVFKESNPTLTGFFEARKEMMYRASEGRIGFDTTLLFYKWGPFGIPFRMLTGMFAPLRAVPFVGMIPEPFSRNGFFMGYSFVAISTWIHLVALAFVLPHIMNGLYVSFLVKRYFPYLVLFVFLLTIVTVFSQQDRHKIIFLWMYPIFVSISLNQYFSDHGRSCLFSPSFVRLMRVYILVVFVFGNFALLNQ